MFENILDTKEIFTNVLNAKVLKELVANKENLFFKTEETYAEENIFINTVIIPSLMQGMGNSSEYGEFWWPHEDYELNREYIINTLEKAGYEVEDFLYTFIVNF